MKLRQYQELAIHHVQRRIEHGESRLYVSLPTGTGKSIILTTLAEQEREAGRVLVLTHRQDIALQLSKTFQEAGHEVGLVMQRHQQFAAQIVVATVQSLTLIHLQQLMHANEEPFATILIDEAHHAVVGSAYERIITEIEAYDEALQVVTVGFTATPYRSDPKSMFSLLPTCAFARDIPDMVRAGVLAPLVWKPVQIDLNFDEIATTIRSGERDYVEHELATSLLRRALTENIVQHVVPLIESRPTLAFAASIAHAEQLAETFRQQGVQAVAISGKTPRAARENIYADWRTGAIQVVCNCSLLTEGFDFPEIAALIIARPTLSPLLYLQMLGRGIRTAQGKKECLVIDVMGNQPDSSSQVVLPHVVGINKPEASKEPGETATTTRQTTDPLLKAILGADTETGLSLLDPIGQSHYRWTAYDGGYFAMVSKEVAAILECDPEGSGLYRSRVYAMPRGQEPKHTWIEQAYLPLRQQVALVHEHTSSLYVEVIGSRDATWLSEPATDKQLGKLWSIHPRLARQARANGWTKQMATDVITYYSLRNTLKHPPQRKVKYS